MNRHAFSFYQDKVVLIKPYELSEADWNTLFYRFNRLGYGLKDIDSTIDAYEKLTRRAKDAGYPGYILQPDQAGVILELLGKQMIRQGFDQNMIEAAAYRAEAYYGITDNYDFAGYLDTNGTFLDFSMGQNFRCSDHREIREILDEKEQSALPDSMSAPMIRFMNYGNIRLMPEVNGIDLIKAPNQLQRQALRDFIDYYNGEVSVDYTNEEGLTVGNTAYRYGTCSERILCDIESYFRTLHVPEGTVSYDHEYCLE